MLSGMQNLLPVRRQLDTPADRRALLVVLDIASAAIPPGISTDNDSNPFGFQKNRHHPFRIIRLAVLFRDQVFLHHPAQIETRNAILPRKPFYRSGGYFGVII
jgi:hypothetical protein